jgi:hypothetical protein
MDRLKGGDDGPDRQWRAARTEYDPTLQGQWVGRECLIGSDLRLAYRSTYVHAGMHKSCSWSRADAFPDRGTFGDQYNHGLDLIERSLEEFGYDPRHFL